MYINELNIEKYKVLENIHISFQVPEDNRNALNILAGPNGCGKTSLLDMISNLSYIGKKSKDFRDASFSFCFFDKYIAKKWRHTTVVELENYPDFSDLHKLEVDYLHKNQTINGIHTSPRIIYLPNTISLQYKLVYYTSSYSFVNIINSENILGSAEFYIKEYVIAKERQSTKSDPKERAKDAVDSFNSIFYNTDFVTKLVDLDPFQNNRPIFETINHERVTIEQLSDGEKQLYGRVVSLLMLNPHNSLILIDEPEIGLHPKWQHTIMDIYKNIGQNNQFIIATHSPHIIAKAHFRELILLKKANNRIIAEQFDKPPTSRDINSVLGGIMDSSYIPDNIMQWHRQYRDFVEKGKKDTPEAQELRGKILEYEPEESEFMQSIRFYEELSS